jgi:opacity protein-like surface antigen
MNRSIFLVVTVCFLFVAFAPLTSYAGDTKGPYIVVKPGAYFPTGDLEDRGFDNSFSGELAIGTYYTPNIILESGVGYFETKASTDTTDDKVWVIPVTATCKGVIPLKMAELTAGGGVGVYFANATASGAGFSNDAHSVALGLHVVAGVNVDISPRVFLGAEGKYIFTTGAHFFGEKVNLDGFTVSGVAGYRF